MRSRGSGAVLASAALTILGVLAVFGIELSDTQAKSRRDVEVRVHERAVVAAALIDSLFQSAQLQVRQDEARYGTREVSSTVMNSSVNQNAYLALLDSSDRVLAASAGFTAQARADLAISAALALVRSGHPFGLGNILPYRAGGVINLAVPFPTRYGRRILLTGIVPSALGVLLGGELRRIPGVRGSRNYILDANRAVIASTDVTAPVGRVLRSRSSYYYDRVGLTNSTWRLVLGAPDGPLFASVSGLRKWIPWMILGAFALVAAAALALGARILRVAEGRVSATQTAAVSQRHRLERQIAQMQRLESLGALAGGVAHDFNNLLAVILNYSGFVAEEVSAAVPDDPARWSAVAADVNEIERAARRAAGLTRQLLAFARREVTRPEVINLGEVVSETEQLLRRTLGEHIEMRTSLADDLPAVLADPGQIEQVLVNLAVNARDAMPDGGTLVIETSAVEVDADYSSTRPDLAPGRYARIRVSDTGMGMDPEVVEHAFEPFFTTKPEGEGTGLGLATVYGIVTQSGGRVSLYSEPGIGTTCAIMLPATEQHAVARPGLPSRAQEGRGEVILLVEDEAGIREVARRILLQRGYRVLAAANGPEALEVAGSHGGPIDLLMTDVIMPRMLGKEVAQRVRAIRPEVRVMYMSGYAQPILDANANVPDGMILLEKPFTEQMLLEKVREALLCGEPAS